MRKFGVLLVSAAAAGLWIPAVARANDTVGNAEGEPVAGNDDDVVILGKSAGQEVGNHSYSHSRMWGLFPAPYVDEIRRTDALLRAQGAAPVLFRPPYGKKLTGLPLAVERTGYRMVTWDIADPDEARDATAYANRVLTQVRPGSIILIHAMYSSRRIAREALPLILAGLRQRGYRAVSVSELLRHRMQGLAKPAAGD